MTHATIRKLHNYFGLYLLLFLWLFSISGLVLNHSKWVVANFWKVREETITSRSIQAPKATGDIAIAEDLMAQVGVVGEIEQTKRSADGEQFEFQVVKPGRVFRVAARLDSARVKITEIRLNAWGVLDALHKFTGVRMDEPARTRDWADEDLESRYGRACRWAGDSRTEWALSLVATAGQTRVRTHCAHSRRCLLRVLPLWVRRARRLTTTASAAWMTEEVMSSSSVH